MRLFVAFEISPALRGLLANRIAEARDLLPNVRWVRPRNLHLTLFFLGQTDERELAALQVHLEQYFSRCGDVRLETARAGIFPQRGRGRVGWIGVAADRALMELQAGLAQELQAPRDGDDRRRYRPHITIARARRPWSADLRASFLSLFADCTDQWWVARALLMRSELGAGGAEYHVLREYPLPA